MTTRSKTQKMTIFTLLLAMSILMNMIEPSVPIPGVPGVKFGLANTLGLIVLYMFGEKSFLQLGILRVLFSTLLRGIFLGIGFWLSLSGVLLSSLAVIILKRITKMSPIGLSVGSAAFHNLGQIIALVYIIGSWGMIYWLPMMLFTGIPTGILTGMVSKMILTRFKKWRTEDYELYV